MSDFIQHISHAKHNIDFLETFYPTYKSNDWAITVSFYSAVHIIEACIYKKEKINFKGEEKSIRHSDQLNLSAYVKEIKTHHVRRNLIVEENFKEIAYLFSSLYNESITARYKSYSYEKFKTDIIVKTAFNEIIKWFDKEFGKESQIKLTLNLK